MAQDARGKLWIGTQDGLVRYDGHGYQVYHPRPGDPHTLSGGLADAQASVAEGRMQIFVAAANEGAVRWS